MPHCISTYCTIRNKCGHSLLQFLKNGQKCNISNCDFLDINICIKYKNLNLVLVRYSPCCIICIYKNLVHLQWSLSCEHSGSEIKIMLLEVVINSDLNWLWLLSEIFGSLRYSSFLQHTKIMLQWNSQ